MYWIGYIYRYWCFTDTVSSKNLYRRIKPDELRKLYFPYHSMDPGQAVERIKEAKTAWQHGSSLKKVDAILACEAEF